MNLAVDLSRRFLDAADGGNSLTTLPRSSSSTQLATSPVSTAPAPATPTIATAADLILLKLYAGGVQDRWDIQQLLASTPDGLVLTEIDEKVRELPERSQVLWRDLRAGA
ncbi:MAG TPA: hypothetical protein VF331_24255 [Polyangiales bacterium]